MTDEQLIEMIQIIEKGGSRAAQNYNRFDLTKPMRELLELRAPGTVVPKPEEPTVSLMMIVVFICVGFLVFSFGVRAPSPVIYAMSYTTIIAIVTWIITD